MTVDELTAVVRAALAALAPVGCLSTGFSVHRSTDEAIAAALEYPGARFILYDRVPDRGYVRLVIDGVDVGIHDVLRDAAAAAGFVVPTRRHGERRRR